MKYNLLKNLRKTLLFLPLIYSLSSPKLIAPEFKSLPIEYSKPIIKRKIIVLDPGHGMGNRDKGLLDWGISYKEYKEAEIVLEKAKNIEKMLDQTKYKVILTRKDNKTHSPIESRPELANENEADIFISIHVNGYQGWKNISGSEVYYRKDSNKELKSKSRKLAKIAAKHLEEMTFIPNRAILQEDYLMLKEIKCPAALLDVGYLLNEKDRNTILNTDYVERAIVKTIEEYLK